jgi:hypothetical protein
MSGEREPNSILGVDVGVEFMMNESSSLKWNSGAINTLCGVANVFDHGH